MKIKERIVECFRKNKFMKSVSMLVLICFVWGIIGPNLAYAQAYAQVENKDLRKHNQDNVNVGAMSVKDAAGTSGFTKDEDNVIKKDGKLWGIWDEEKGVALQSTPDGFKENRTITNIIKRQDAGYSGEENKEVAAAQQQALPENAPAAEAPQDPISVENKMEIEAEVNRMQEALEANAEQGSNEAEEIINEGNKSDTQIPQDDKYNAGAMEELRVIINNLDREFIDFSKVVNSGITGAIQEILVKGISLQEKEKESKYDPEIVSALMEQTGLSEEEVIEMLSKAEEESKKIDAEKGLPEGTTFNESMEVLKEYLAGGGSILNCASSALSNVIGIGEGILALMALAIDIGAGNFSKDSIQDGQLTTSMNAINEVAQEYGIESAGYATSIEDFINDIQPGEQAIVWVDENHYITVTKNEDGTFNVIDPNKNNGNAQTFSKEEFVKILNGQEGKTTDGQAISGYTKVTDETGQMKVVTDSKSVAQNAQELSAAQMKEVRGAKGSSKPKEPTKDSVLNDINKNKQYVSEAELNEYIEQGKALGLSEAEILKMLSECIAAGYTFADMKSFFTQAQEAGINLKDMMASKGSLSYATVIGVVINNGISASQLNNFLIECKENGIDPQDLIKAVIGNSILGGAALLIPGVEGSLLAQIIGLSESGKEAGVEIKDLGNWLKEARKSGVSNEELEKFFKACGESGVNVNELLEKAEKVGLSLKEIIDAYTDEISIAAISEIINTAYEAGINLGELLAAANNYGSGLIGISVEIALTLLGYLVSFADLVKLLSDKKAQGSEFNSETFERLVKDTILEILSAKRNGTWQTN